MDYIEVTESSRMLLLHVWEICSIAEGGETQAAHATIQMTSGEWHWVEESYEEVKDRLDRCTSLTWAGTQEKPEPSVSCVTGSSAKNERPR